MVSQRQITLSYFVECCYAFQDSMFLWKTWEYYSEDDTVGFIGLIFLILLFLLQVYSLQHSKEDRLAYLDHIPGGEITVQLLVVVFGVLALAYLSGCYVRVASQILAVLLPLVVLFIDGNIGYWHHTCRVEFWNQMKLIGQSIGIFGAVLILATDS